MLGLRLLCGEGNVSKRITVMLMIALAINLRAFISDAAPYNLTATGAPLASTPATNCGALLSDAYDDFCASDPGGNSTCECDSFNANISGNQVGKVSDLSGTLHVTVDNGAAVDTPDCQPIFGELTFAATKDAETIYLNGARCNAQGAGNPTWKGGWGTFSSANGFKALGTLSWSFNPIKNLYTLTLMGKTQP